MADTTADLTDEQWRAWAREHKVCYEVRPLLQKDGEELVQVGFEFEIAARLPKGAGPGGSRQQMTQHLLRAMAQLAAGCFPPKARWRVSSWRPSSRLAVPAEGYAA